MWTTGGARSVLNQGSCHMSEQEEQLRRHHQKQSRILGGIFPSMVDSCPQDVSDSSLSDISDKI